MGTGEPRAWRRITTADQIAMPWKNGGGVTREIAAAGGSLADGSFAWRVSMADVAQSGPFSVFPGVDRTLLLVQGVGMDLTIDGRVTRVDQPFVPVRFAGEATCSAALLGGPVVDFNVMTARARARHVLDVPLLAQRTEVAGRVLALLVHVFSGDLVARTQDRSEVAVSAGATLVAEVATATDLVLDVTPRIPSRCAVVRVWPSG